MPHHSNRWTLVLAAGSGTRLASLTSNGGSRAVPKQYCSLNGGRSLLEETLARARAVSDAQRTLVVVAAEHREHWSQALEHAWAENVIVQPRNRGTANGILLGVSAILERDPSAVVAILPSDHFVAHEDVLRRSLSRALALAESSSGASAVHFLGIKPDMADPELGYIVRGASLVDGSVAVAGFVEKPSREIAERLVRRGALWNSFILVARARALVDLIERRYPAEVAAFASLWRRHVGRTDRLQDELEQLYVPLREIDFSRGVVEGTEADLRVVPVPYCGWSDLGTPSRVGACIAQARPPAARSRHFNLAEAYDRVFGGAASTARVA